MHIENYAFTFIFPAKMWSYKKSTIALFLILAVFVRDYKCDEDDDYVTIEDTNDVTTKAMKNAGKGRILWPYPINYKADDEEKEQGDKNEETAVKVEDDAEQEQIGGVSRKGRFLWSYPQSPIFNMMLQTASVNYSPQSTDPFDFLRDSYPLPKGKCHQKHFTNLNICNRYDV